MQDIFTIMDPTIELDVIDVRDNESKPENSTCYAKIHGVCNNDKGYDLTIHHKRGRNKYFLDTSTWIAVCMCCHQWIETHVEQAKLLGFSESRLSKTND